MQRYLQTLALFAAGPITLTQIRQYFFLEAANAACTAAETFFSHLT